MDGVRDKNKDFYKINEIGNYSEILQIYPSLRTVSPVVCLFSLLPNNSRLKT